MPRNWAARARAAAWLPEEWVTTPFAASASVNEKTALQAPRDLKAPAAWRFSHLKKQSRAALLVERVAGEDRGALDERPDAFVSGANECRDQKTLNEIRIKYGGFRVRDQNELATMRRCLGKGRPEGMKHAEISAFVMKSGVIRLSEIGSMQDRV